MTEQQKQAALEKLTLNLQTLSKGLEDAVIKCEEESAKYDQVANEGEKRKELNRLMERLKGITTKAGDELEKVKKEHGK